MIPEWIQLQTIVCNSIQWIVVVPQLGFRNSERYAPQLHILSYAAGLIYAMYHAS